MVKMQIEHCTAAGKAKFFYANLIAILTSSILIKYYLLAQLLTL